MIELTPNMVETVHHKGGCFLGLAKTDFNATAIVDFPTPPLPLKKCKQAMCVSKRNVSRKS